MLKFIKPVLASLTVGLALLTAGCQSDNDDKHDHSGTMATDSSGQAVACETCKITWVKSPVKNDKGRVIAYKTAKSHECPDCRSAAQNFFTTGNLKHECATCGKDAMQKCETHISKS